uniref:Uncharacterized protein n=1 Tax=Anguilla anguilla TaxID=7936 RepID=A0A0E9T2E1_ANGAN
MLLNDERLTERCFKYLGIYSGFIRDLLLEINSYIHGHKQNGPSPNLLLPGYFCS